MVVEGRRVRMLVNLGAPLSACCAMATAEDRSIANMMRILIGAASTRESARARKTA
jgi:hypothetical protein